MSYPARQAEARKKEESKYGNISSVPILRGGHESGGLGSRPGRVVPTVGENTGGTFIRGLDALASMRRRLELELVWRPELSHG